MTSDHRYVQHIFDCITTIEAFTENGYAEFAQSVMAQNAVMYQFMIMGEATKRISQETHDSYSSIPWRPMARFRDVLIHGYSNINIEEVWRTVENDLPSLKRSIHNLLIELADDDKTDQLPDAPNT